MKYIKYICLAVALLLCVNVNADKRKGKKAQKREIGMMMTKIGGEDDEQ